ncbi:MAG: sugar ABC transporter substrate-binding protein [Candidatus Omnitrophota bacterium]
MKNKNNYFGYLIILGFCLSVLLIFIPGCGRKVAPLSIKVMWWGDIYNQAFAQKLVEAYNKSGPSIKVSLYAPPGDYWSKLLTMLAGDTAPDVILLNPPQVNELANKGSLLPLDNFKKDPAFIAFQNDTWKSLRGQFSCNGHLYAMPIWTSSIGIFYNKQLFDEAGVPYPSKNWDFEELLEKAKSLTTDTNGDGRIDRFGFGGFPLNLSEWNLYMLIEAFGGKMYSRDYKKCLIDSPESIAAVKWAIELSTKYRVAPNFTEISAGNPVVSAGGPDLFQGGKVAMVFWGRWYLDALSKNKNLKWGVAPYPHGKRKIMFQVPIYLGIYSKTKYPQECWEFVKFVTGKEGQRKLALERTDIPVLRSAASSSEFLKYAGREDVNRLFLEMLDYAELPTYIPGEDQWKKFAQDKITLVVLGKMDLQKACREIAQDYQKLVQ